MMAITTSSSTSVNPVRRDMTLLPEGEKLYLSELGSYSWTMAKIAIERQAGSRPKVQQGLVAANSCS
jgi:hypothetical protein